VFFKLIKVHLLVSELYIYIRMYGATKEIMQLEMLTAVHAGYEQYQIGHQHTQNIGNVLVFVLMRGFW